MKACATKFRSKSTGPIIRWILCIGMYAYVRTARQPEQAFSSIRQVVNNLDPNLPVFQMKTLEAQMEESLITERLVATLSTGFGILATLLAAIGLYGVMAYMVAQRTREIGVRMALGAASARRGVAGDERRRGAGRNRNRHRTPGAWALTRMVKSQLYGIEPNDPFTVAAAALGIACVALLAGYIPARKATRVEPMIALRWE